MTDESPAEPSIRLDQFLKREGIAGTGGQAKMLVQSGAVRVNGEVETRRRRQLRSGDEVAFEDASVRVEFPD